MGQRQAGAGAVGHSTDGGLPCAPCCRRARDRARGAVASARLPRATATRCGAVDLLDGVNDSRRRSTPRPPARRQARGTEPHSLQTPSTGWPSRVPMRAVDRDGARVHRRGVLTKLRQSAGPMCRAGCGQLRQGTTAMVAGAHRDRRGGLIERRSSVRTPRAPTHCAPPAQAVDGQRRRLGFVGRAGCPSAARDARRRPSLDPMEFRSTPDRDRVHLGPSSPKPASATVAATLAFFRVGHRWRPRALP